jgi:hypothetical protein
LKGDLLVGLVVDVAVTSSWKLLKRHEILLCGSCEGVLELIISGVEENLTIRRGPIFMEGLEEEGELS